MPLSTQPTRVHLIYLIITLAGLFLLAATACQSSVKPTVPVQGNPTGSPIPSVVQVQAVTPTTAYTSTSQPSPSISPTKTSEPTNTSTPPNTPVPSYTPIPSPTLTPSLTPTYAILRGTVLEQANCRYGPGAAYLYKYGLYPGNNIEIFGRNEMGTWITIRAIGGTNPCWVKASLLDIKGDVMSVAPTELPLPMSPYYGPLTGIHAEREGNNVTLSWNPLILRAGDDSLQYPYLIEAWLCQDGLISFMPIGSWETILTVQDEAGCSAPSHARIYGVEKHGYTRWKEIPWPAP